MAERKNSKPRAERPKPVDEPEPAVVPADPVNQEIVARVLRRSGLRPLHFDLAAIVEEVNLRGATIQDAAAKHKKR